MKLRQEETMLFRATQKKEKMWSNYLFSDQETTTIPKGVKNKKKTYGFVQHRFAHRPEQAYAYFHLLQF